MAGTGGLDVVVGHALGTILMTVRGQLRRSTSERFQSKLDKALRQAPERLVIDLSDATIDDEGARLLRKARSTAEGHQVQLVLTSRNREMLAAIEGGEPMPLG